ncbi:MAG: acyl carrier protein [Lachnospiraceae bacterium]|nr:acyl carrier protein [Lachnospiraceae bacterium]
MFEKIAEIIAEELNLGIEELTMDTDLKTDLGADSLDLYHLVMALEDEYSIEIEDSDLEKIHTIGDVVNYLKDKGIEE